MNRRGFLKLLAATIAAPFVGKMKLIKQDTLFGYPITYTDKLPKIDDDVIKIGNVKTNYSKWVKFQVQDSPGTWRDIPVENICKSRIYMTDELLSDCGITSDEIWEAQRQIGRVGFEPLDKLICNGDTIIEIRVPYETHEITDWDLAYRDLYGDGDDDTDNDDWE